MSDIIRSTISKLPLPWQRELRRLNLLRQIKLKKFQSPEPEFELLGEFVSRGDWVLDVGANVGHYTAQLSRLVGPEGQVFAFEPTPETFALLAWNLQVLRCDNVTLFKAAVGEDVGVAQFSIPKWSNGLRNFYQAHLTSSGGEAAYTTFRISIDQLKLPKRVSLVKVDVEGEELSVVRGMISLLRRDNPVLVLENSGVDLQSELLELGYKIQRLEGSPNILCEHNGLD